MDRTGGDNAKQNKSSRERQLSYGFTHMQNISRKIGRRRKGRRKIRAEINDIEIKKKKPKQ